MCPGGSHENVRTGATLPDGSDSKPAWHSDRSRWVGHGDFRKVAEPRELLGQLANLFVVIARHRKDFLAANLLAVLQSLRLAPDAEIPKETEDLIDLNGGVETVEDRSGLCCYARNENLP